MSPQQGCAQSCSTTADRIKKLPADILEVNIDAVWTGRFQTFSQLGLATVEAGIESEFVLNEAAFLFAPGNADGPAAFDLGDLADQRSDGARSRSDDDALSGLCGFRGQD